MKVLLSWSSGKDSAWALHLLRQQHPGAVAALLTTLDAEHDRVAMHGVSRTVVEAQAAAAGLPLRIALIPIPCPNTVYEAQMRLAAESAARDGFTHIAFGDLFLDEIRRYREATLRGTGLQALFPVWGLPTGALAADMLAGGLKATLTCVDTRRLDTSFVGREFDRALLADLPAGIDPCGENGEFHTCVYAGPMFARPLTLTSDETVADEPFVWQQPRLATPA